MFTILATPYLLNHLAASPGEANDLTSVSILLPAIIPAVIITSFQVIFLRLKPNQGIAWLMGTAGGLMFGLPSAVFAMLLSFAGGFIPRQLPASIGNLLAYVVIFVGGGIGGLVSGPIMWAAFNRRFFWRWFLGSIFAWSDAIGVMISAIPAIQYRYSTFANSSLVLGFVSFLEGLPIYVSAALIGA